ncbi:MULTISPECIES: hypothetical protein [Corynebacterium]|uniref:Uncharacterized protein n=4 Tax=Corynebacterium TaxID=1716 RepID=A0A0E3N742_9CORY|nr:MULTISPECIES: hypothetical protein [Corynebacterium]AEG81088.1 putative secreted protein [Corynebacterium ulcerans 809]AIU32143.1 Hypothetical protein CulFRC11_0550 [Corynebacterium ramonii FRC0011]AKA96102.1 Hypothetical protein CUL131002_0554c [Corynebacterium ulcerans]AKN76470.1 Hypothetical protein CulFRC58_0616 [Corynebacterium ulcerans FRC58]ARU45635.1 hypothetical protein CBE74_02990 [Corynebacterium silvaticum]
MKPRDPQPQETRKKLVRDSILGFVGFFAFLALVQAVVNLFQPQPSLWPAFLALILVIATIALWRAWR